ncbi:MAG: hypothetical protein HeimAB125_16750, partial [Candidatus Heimdallarchaeota archaeon AB_125]
NVQLKINDEKIDLAEYLKTKEI